MAQLRRDVDKSRKDCEQAINDKLRARDDLLKSEAKILDLQKQVESWRKSSESYAEQYAKVRDKNPLQDDDSKRTSRVQGMQKELNEVLDENNVSVRTALFTVLLL